MGKFLDLGMRLMTYCYIDDKNKEHKVLMSS